ncbi:PREDICTED: uncharacterized protein LOC109336886 [Lupinus angustifolius]|uniref:uncharacterized protein LOC109336886 n=1 Tax=Lupinus angustifolius TaxID=3871 RepID=UPI00092FBEC1|nr:PREDICTED: uncharacterized protein LOC109336886 [Lupinus angustifolius]
MANGNGFSLTLPILDTKNYDRWRIQMKAIFGFQELANFAKIDGAKTTTKAWDNLEKSYEGAVKIKKVKLQTMRRRYELLQMEENETISDYLTKIMSLTNQMKACGEEIRDQSVIEKVLRTLTPKYDHIVVAIEESKDLEAYKFEELQSSLEAHEQRLKERNKDKWQNDKWRNGEGLKNEQGFQEHDHKRGSNWNSVNKKKIDKKRIQCYNCRNYGHYAAEFNSNKILSKKDEEARLAQGAEPDDGDHYLLMTTIKNSEEDEDI